MSALGHNRTFAVQKRMSALPPLADKGGRGRMPLCAIIETFNVRAHKELLEVCHRHHGSNRVGNETILVGGMVHFIELFRTGFSVAAPCNLWA